MSDRTDNLIMGRTDKSSITEILDTTNDAIQEITIKYKSGNILIVRV